MMWKYLVPLGYDWIYYIHKVIRIGSLAFQVLQNQNSSWSRLDLVQILDSDEFYQRLHERELTLQDRKTIQEFIFHALTPTEWEDFLRVCRNNELNPYEEIRDLIYSAYAKILRQAK